MPLDPKPLANAVARLREGLERHRSTPDDEQLRDGLIQRFEFTYELSCRSLRGYLKQHAPSPGEVAGMSFADLIRTAKSLGLIRSDWSAWRWFRHMRIRTSHCYENASLKQIVRRIPAFLKEAEYLLERLSDVIDQAVSIDFANSHQRIILAMMREHLPAGTAVWVFGSRATGRARAYSVLDVAIDAGRALTLDETALLREAFGESDLPYRVDIVDWQTIGDDFRRLIAGERVPLPLGTAPQPSSGA